MEEKSKAPTLHNEQAQEETTKVDFMSRHELQNLQEKKLKAMLPYINEVPFYRKKFEAHNFDIKKFRHLSDLTKLPFTTKEELRQSAPMDRAFLKDSTGIAFFFSSSGTTGMRTLYPLSRKDIVVFEEVASRIMRRVGIKPGDIALVLSPFGMSAMGYYMTSQYLTVGAGVVPLGITSFEDIAKALKTFPVTAMATLPIVVSRLSEFLTYKYKGISFLKHMRQFHLGGDYLSDARRQRIEEYWKADCLNFYGLSEIFGPIAGECPEKDGLHLAADYILTEVIDPETKEPVSDGEVGVAVYTTLWDKGAPLLRFWSDDCVALTYERCRCGRTSPRIYYKGRLTNSPIIKGKRIFIKDIEETLLSFPELGNEWRIKISGTSDQSKAIVYIERRPWKRISAEVLNKLKHEHGEQMRIPIEVEAVPFGTFPRKDLKPARITDVRVLK